MKFKHFKREEVQENKARKPSQAAERSGGNDQSSKYKPESAHDHQLF